MRKILAFNLTLPRLAVVAGGQDGRVFFIHGLALTGGLTRGLPDISLGHRGTHPGTQALAAQTETRRGRAPGHALNSDDKAEDDKDA